MIHKKIIFSTSAGHMLECFDITLYGFFAVMLAPIFFPSDNFSVSMIGSFVAFAAGFIMRPLGGIIFGHLGDRFGRRVSFLASISLISLPTFCIGCLPSYATIGIAAPILLLIFRLLQGISLGGEYGGAAVFIWEHVEKDRPGFSGSFLVTLGFVGAIAGTLMGSFFTKVGMPSWAWRIPFIIGGFFGIIVFFVRQSLAETPAFNTIKIKKDIVKFPILSIFKNNFKNILCGIGIGANTIIPFYLGIIYASTYYKEKFGLPISNIMAINTGIMLLWVVLLPIVGYFSDNIGRKKIMLWSAICTTLAAYPILYIIQNTKVFLVFLLCQIIVSLASIPYVAVSSSILPTLFLPQERYTGSAFSFSLGVAIFGGTAPLAAIALINAGITLGPAIYLGLSGFFGWLAVYKATLYE